MRKTYRRRWLDRHDDSAVIAGHFRGPRASPSASDNLIGAASLVAFGALSSFILVNYSVISHHFVRGHRRSGTDLLRYLVLPGVGMLVCAVLLFNVDTSAKILGLVWLAAGVPYLGVTTRGFRNPPADFAMAEDDEAPGARERAESRGVAVG